MSLWSVYRGDDLLCIVGPCGVRSALETINKLAKGNQYSVYRNTDAPAEFRRLPPNEGNPL